MQISLRKALSAMPIVRPLILALLIGLIGVPVNTGEAWAATPVIVSNLSDSGAGSLRDAIAGAASGTTITFDGSLSGTITLSSQLTIDRDLTIRGPGSGILTVSGDNQCRVFKVTGGLVQISGLTVANGKAVGNSGGYGDDGASGGGGGGGAAGGGGGLLVTGGRVFIDDVAFANNTAVGGMGGAGGAGYRPSGSGNGGNGGLSDIYTYTAPVAGIGNSLDNSSRYIDATFYSGGGGGYGRHDNRDSAGLARGGSGAGGNSAELDEQYNETAGTIDNRDYLSNGTASGNGGTGGAFLLDQGGYFYGGNGGNGGNGLGGGICITSGTIAIANSSFSGNRAVGGQGGTSGKSDYYKGNYEGWGGRGGKGVGGAIYVGNIVNATDAVTITNSTFSGNSVSGGAAGEASVGGLKGAAGTSFAADICEYSRYGVDVRNVSGLNGYAGLITQIGGVDARWTYVRESRITLPADGITTATIRVELRDSTNLPVFGERVTLDQGSGHSIISPATATTDVDGAVTFAVTNTWAETVTYRIINTSANNAAVGQSYGVTFFYPAAGKSSVTANPTGVSADGTSQTAVTVTLRYPDGSPAPNKSVTLGQGAGSSVISPAGSVTDSNGQATFRVTNTNIETVTYTAVDTTDNVTVSQTASVSFTPGRPDAVKSTVKATSTQVLANGNDSSTIAVTLRDVIGHPVGGKTVVLSQGAGDSTISPASAVTDSNGVASFTVKTTKAGSATYTATDTTDNVAVTETVTVTFGSYDWKVTSLSDDGSTGTLRYAMVNAPAGTTITFQKDLVGTITLQNALPAISRDLIIDGSGATVTVSGNNLYRVFEVDGGAVAIKAITVANGRAEGTSGVVWHGEPGASAAGGGLLVTGGTVVVDGVSFDHNRAIGGGGGAGYMSNGGRGGDGEGGAVSLEAGSMTISNSRFVGNGAHGGAGGLTSGSYGYHAGDGGDGNGGAMFVRAGTLTINNSTFDGNQATGGKGNSGTYASNGGNVRGGSLYIGSGSLVVTSCQFQNGALVPGLAGGDSVYPAGPGNGKGVDIYSKNGAVTLASVTLTAGADSYRNDSPADASTSTAVADKASVQSNGVETVTITVTLRGATGTSMGSGRTVTLSQGSGSSRITPLSALTDINGAATFTVSDTKAETVTYTARDSDGNVTVAKTAIVTFSPYGWVVTELNDGDSIGSLRYALTNAPAGATIVFAGGLSGTIALQSRLPVLSRDLTIDGSGANVTISAASQFRVFEVTGGTVSIKAITVADGSVTGADGKPGTGGGLLVTNGTVNADGVTFKDNTAAGYPAPQWGFTAGDGGDAYGGAAYIGPGGAMAISNSRFEGNRAQGGAPVQGFPSSKEGNALGGALFVNAGSLTVTNSVFTGNTLGGNSEIALDLYNQGGTVTFSGVAFDYYNVSSIDAGRSTVAANPGSVTADTVSASTITVAVKDAKGSPVGAGKTVNLIATPAGSVITPVNGNVTDVNGTVTFTVTHNKSENVTYSATADSVSVTQTATVAFTQYDWSVSTLTDGTTPGTLRYALANAPAGTRIAFRSGLAGTMVLQSQLPAINRNLTIDGSGASITISGDDKFRVLQVDGGTVVIRNIAVVNGKAAGSDGGVFAPGNDGNGGGLLITGGTVSLEDVTFSSNQAIGGAGGAGQFQYDTLRTYCPPGGTGAGGAIYLSAGSLTVDNGGFDANRAVGGNGWAAAYEVGLGGSGSGGAIFVKSGSLTISNSHFSGDSAVGGLNGTGSGGAVFVDSGSLTVTNGQFSGEKATGGNGNNGTAYAIGDRGGDGCGGAIYANAGTVTINTSQFSGDVATGGNGSASVINNVGAVGGNGWGGAIFAKSASLTINGSQFSGTSAVGGAGGQGTSTPGNPGSGAGADVYNDKGALTLTGVTLSGTNTTFNAAPASAGGSSVAVSKAGATDNGMAAFRITVTLRDANGNVINGSKQVTLTADSATSAVAPVNDGWTDDAGKAVFDVTTTGTDVVTVVYTATDVTDSVTITQTATAKFAIAEFTLAYRAMSGGTVSVTTPQTRQYGESGPTVSAVPDAGYQFWGWSDGSFANPRTDASVTKDIDVVARFYPVSTKLIWEQQPGGGVAGQVWAQQPVLYLADSTGARADFDSTSEVTVQLTSGNGLSGSATVKVQQGRATFSDLLMVTSGEYTLTASRGSITSQPSAKFQITAGTPYAGRTEMAAEVTTASGPNGSPVANGSDYWTVTVTVNDVYGNPVTGQEVGLYGSDSMIVVPANGISDQNGKAVFQVKSTKAEYYTCKTTAGLSYWPTANIWFSPGLADQLAVTSSGSYVAGAEQSVTVTALDHWGNVVTDYTGTVHFSTNNGISASLPSDYTFTAGDYGTRTFAVTLYNAAKSWLTVEDKGASISGTMTGITVVPGPVDKDRSTVTVIGASSVTANGSDAATISVTVTDAFGNAISDKAVTLNQESGKSSSISPVSATTGAAGLASFNVTNTKAETVRYTATVDEIELTEEAIVEFVPGQLNGLDISVSGAQTAGVSFNVTVTACDAQGNTRADYVGSVSFSTDIEKSPDGKYTQSLPSTYTFTAADAGTHTFEGVTLYNAKSTVLSVTDDGKRTTSKTIAVSPGDVKDSLLEADKQTAVANNVDSVTFTVTLLDQYGNPVGGKTVVLSQSSGKSSIISPASTSSDADGEASFSVVSAKAETVTYTASADGDSLAQSVDVTFTPGPVSSVRSTMAVSKSLVAANGKSSALITVSLRDVYGNAISDKTVSLSQSAGGGNASSTIAPATSNSDAYGAATFTVSDGVVEDVTYSAEGDGVKISRGVVIRFAQPRTVSVTANMPAGGTVSGGGEYANGEYVTVTATPAAGYDFLTWDGGPAPVSTAGYSFRLTSDMSLVANFQPKSCPLTITAGAGGTITTGTSGDYAPGAVISITAGPTSGYRFDRWTSTGGGVFANAMMASTTFTMPANAATIKADFVVVDDTPAPPTAPTYTADVTGAQGNGPALQVTVDANTGAVAVDLRDRAAEVFSSGEATVITVPAIEGADSYSLDLPASSLSNTGSDAQVTLATSVGSITIPADMLAGTQDAASASGGEAAITIAQADKTSLTSDVQQAIGDRPVVQLSLSLNGQQTEWENPNAPVTVSITYTPTEDELKNPEHIVVWYIDGSGNVISVPTGRFVAPDKVVFTTTHFSYYAVAFVNKTFDDLGSAEWARQAVEVLASRGVIQGTSATTYAPEANITRADFVVLLARTLGLSGKPADNFDDIQPGAYYYDAVGAAKALGIVTGSGGNRFNPRENITRQDMMVMMARALSKLKGISNTGDPAALAGFKDKGDVADYAAGSLAALVQKGLIKGSGDKLNPLGLTTRAEAAMFLYRISDN